MISELHSLWRQDQLIAFAASTFHMYGKISPEHERAEADRATRVVLEGVTVDTVPWLSDTSLSHVSSTPESFLEFTPKTAASSAQPVGSAVTLANLEAAARANNSAKGLSAIYLPYCVYLLRQSHISLRDWLLWLSRSNTQGRQMTKMLLRKIKDGDDGSAHLSATADSLIELFRDTHEQVRTRVRAVDDLYDLLTKTDHANKHLSSWRRVCLALRNSLYQWPLLVAGAGVDAHGSSLPFGLYVTPDEQSRTYFKVVGHGPSRRNTPRYEPARFDEMQGSTIPAGMENSYLRWSFEWEKGFSLAMRVAKQLWRAQNSRQTLANPGELAAVLDSSLVVDVGPAIEIVDSFYDQPARDGAKLFVLGGRSAEAYWVQAVLALLLPDRLVPLGVATGVVEYSGGSYELKYVDGIDKKLGYANRSGLFSRVILPKSVEFDKEVTSIDARQFLDTLREQKRVEINYCVSARDAADAMQPSGWRRTTFSRLPATQSEFARHLKRLYCKRALEERKCLPELDRRAYLNDPWTEGEERAMRELDVDYTSSTRAVKYVSRTGRPSIEKSVGKWLAWKDDQVRSHKTLGDYTREPGLGVVCIRTTTTDNEMRVWSMIADAVSASSGWWQAFQWSDLQGAAVVLADLLNNRAARPDICSSPSPDLLVVFDDGNLTQRRTNRIFPDDFRGQLCDLLNPLRSDRDLDVPDYLNQALLNGEDDLRAALGRTRILVVYGDSAMESSRPSDVSDTQTTALERLAIFRFGFSAQQAHSILNAGARGDAIRNWETTSSIISGLKHAGKLLISRGLYYLPLNYTKVLRQSSFCEAADNHLHAARILAPVLLPNQIFLSLNADRLLEPEPLLEAIWHLNQARALTSPRDLAVRKQVNDSLATLIFLRPFADWDTVKQLQNGATRNEPDALDLAEVLLNKERQARQPHSSRVALLLNAMGDYAKGLNGSSAAQTLAMRANDHFESALAPLIINNRDDYLERQKRKLVSEYVYCLMCIVPIDPHSVASLARWTTYLNEVVDKICRPDFYLAEIETERIAENYPISRDWFKTSWDSDELSLQQRSRLCYAASRLYVGRWDGDACVSEPWDQPWLEYFNLNSSEEGVVTKQLRAPLENWWQIYGFSERRSAGFGSRLRNLATFQGKGGRSESWIREKIRRATNNIWSYLNHPTDPLWGTPADAAFQVVRALVVGETLYEFEFLQQRGVHCYELWRNLVDAKHECARRLGDDLHTAYATWVCFLGYIDPELDSSVEQLFHWLSKYEPAAQGDLYFHDPESLIDRAKNDTPIVKLFREARVMAVWNGYQLLARKKNDNEWTISGPSRIKLRNAVKQLALNSNAWVFIMASEVATVQTALAVLLMLTDESESNVEHVLKRDSLHHQKASIAKNIHWWLKYAPRDHHRSKLVNLQRCLLA